MRKLLSFFFPLWDYKKPKQEETEEPKFYFDCDDFGCTFKVNMDHPEIKAAFKRNCEILASINKKERN